MKGLEFFLSFFPLPVVSGEGAGAGRTLDIIIGIHGLVKMTRSIALLGGLVIRGRLAVYLSCGIILLASPNHELVGSLFPFK